MNAPRLMSPREHSNENYELNLTSNSHKSLRNISSFKNNKGQKSLNSSSFKTNEEIFPDFGINFDLKNRIGFSKKEMNFGSSSKKEAMVESADILDNNWKSETMTLSEYEEESRENLNESSKILNSFIYMWSFIDFLY